MFSLSLKLVIRTKKCGFLIKALLATGDAYGLSGLTWLGGVSAGLTSGRVIAGSRCIVGGGGRGSVALLLRGSVLLVVMTILTPASVSIVSSIIISVVWYL